MPIDMKSLARFGAEARVTEILSELTEIRRAFPGIGGVRRGRPAAARSEADAPVKRRRKPMTAARKKAVGLRMKKYWAARRRAEGRG